MAELRIQNMHCAACIQRVSETLKGIAGTTVEDVQIGKARIETAAEPARPPATRPGELAGYQNQAYADRYAKRVAAVRAAEAPLGSEALTRAVAVNLFKLMAIKDEYEVARLYSDGRFAATLANAISSPVWAYRLGR